MRFLLVACGAFIGLGGLLTQLPASVLLTVVLSVSPLAWVVLFHEPACARLIRIIKAFTEPKER